MAHTHHTVSYASGMAEVDSEFADWSCDRARHIDRSTLVPIDEIISELEKMIDD